MTVIEILDRINKEMLNNIEVKGRTNVTNLASAMANIENVIQILSEPEDSKSEDFVEE